MDMTRQQDVLRRMIDLALAGEPLGADELAPFAAAGTRQGEIGAAPNLLRRALDAMVKTLLHDLEAACESEGGDLLRVIGWLAVTFVFGAGFIGMEVVEFAKLINDGAGPHVSAFLSSYFFLVGTHGLHVTCGLLWIAVMTHQVYKFGLTGVTRRRLACLSLFWHFLDLIWICVFSFVYLREFL